MNKETEIPDRNSRDSAKAECTYGQCSVKCTQTGISHIIAQDQTSEVALSVRYKKYMPGGFGVSEGSH